ncbi:MAG: class I SAM-dependent methyltransferase [Gammaproteobacteria bacterium]|nr:class I SAM-dependent methyltransferase [Gammaproteobacteria bacterium]
MRRIPEPELMNDPTQALAYAEADFVEPNTAFVDGFAACFPQCQPRRVVDLGCGPGDLTERFAQRYPQCRVSAIDGAEQMLLIARQRAREQGLDGQIDYVCAHLPSAELPTGADVIISNSLLHHMNDAMDLWRSVKQCSVPGSIVYVADLFRPQTTEAAQHIVDTYSEGEPEVLRTDFYHSLLAAYRPDEVEAQLREAGLIGLKVETTSDRHMRISGIVE